MKRIKQMIRRVVLLAGISTCLLWSGQAVVEAMVKSEGQTDQTQNLSTQPQQPLDPSQRLQIPGKEGRLPSGKHRQPEYKKGEIIVKFKDSVTECVHCLLADKKSFVQATIDRSNSLDQFFKKHPIKSTRLLFPQWHDKSVKSSKAKHQKAVEGIKRKFPKRTARIPKNAEVPDLTHTYILEVAEDTDILTLCQELQRDPHVEYAEPNYKVEVQMVPNDPYYHSSGSWGQPYDDLWGIKKIQAERSWDLSQGEGVVVAVVDTGLDYNHPDIATNVWQNEDEKTGDANGDGYPGVRGLDDDEDGLIDEDSAGRQPSDLDYTNDLKDDDDENGYVDDVRGWDFAYNDNDPIDRNGHGTHVSGTIAAVGNNGIGVIGVAPKAKIMSVKGLDDTGSGFNSQLAYALVYAASQGADVLNNSWGYGSRHPSDPVVEDAVRTAYGLGSVIVFSAGNSSDDVSYYSPQNMTDSKPIVVSATDPNDTPTFFTNYGVFVDISAPGGGTTNPPPDCIPYYNILSLKPVDILPFEPCLKVGDDYQRAGGTSMSAPHAAGVAALVLAHTATFTNEDVRQILRVSADDIGNEGIDSYTGAGRLNAEKALTVEAVLQAKITSPVNNSTFNPDTDSITIMGSAFGDGFKQYQLYYGVGDEPVEWFTIGETINIPIENNVLAIWNLADLNASLYSLRLVVTSLEGLQFQDEIQLSLEQPIVQVTTNSSSQVWPDISNEKIVWTDFRNCTESPCFNVDIYLYNLSDSEEQQITTNAASQLFPSISQEKIVWQDSRNDDLSTSDYWETDIYLYDGVTKLESRLTSRAGFYGSPTISGNRIVWLGCDDTRCDVYLYDLSTRQQIRITDDVAYPYWDPISSSDKVVWLDERKGKSDLFVYDLNTQKEKRITTDSDFPNSYYAISGDRLIWSDGSHEVSGSNIYFEDLNTGKRETVISLKFPIIVTDLAISGQRIVWVDDRNGNWDVYCYDLVTRMEQQITTHHSEQIYTRISENRVIWEDYRNGSADIYLYELEPRINHEPIFASINDQSISENQHLSLTVSATDTDQDQLYLEVYDLPIGASFEPAVDELGKIEKHFHWIPQYNQSGNYKVTFRVSDGELSVKQSITITVIDVEQIVPRQITFDPSSQWKPVVFGDRIVWEDSRNGNKDIYFYDLITKKEQQITSEPTIQEGPRGSCDRIVWTDYRNKNTDIYLYDIPIAQEQQITKEGAAQFSPAISGGFIVWTDARSGNYDIYLYDLSTQSSKRITTNTRMQNQPDISDNRIVWEDDRNGNKDIYLYDLTTHQERQITIDLKDQTQPRIFQNRIVWLDRRHDSWDVYLYDLNTAKERRITSIPAERGAPCIFGDWIVWHDYRDGNANIYLYDLGTEKEEQITADPSDQIYPSVWNNRIVWVDYRNGNADIYLYERTNTLLPVLTSIAPIQGGWNGGQEIHIFGQNFTTDLKAYLADVELKGVQVISETEMVAQTPKVDVSEFVDVKVVTMRGEEIILPQAYRYIGYGDVTQDGTVSSLDASMVLQAVSGMTNDYFDKGVPRDAGVMERSDVTGNGTLSGLDASYILKYVVDLITHFPVESGEIPVEEQGAQASLDSPIVKELEEVVMPLTVSQLVNTQGINFTLKYDPQKLELKGVAKGAETSAMSLVSNSAEAGNVGVVLAGSQGISGDNQEVVVLKFLIKEAVGDIKTQVTLEQFYLNETPKPDVLGTITVTNVNQVPVVSSCQVSPEVAYRLQKVTFSGQGTDKDGQVVAYSWRSSIDGDLSTAASFTTRKLSVGDHTISFKVQDNEGAWSEETTRKVTVKRVW